MNKYLICFVIIISALIPCSYVFADDNDTPYEYNESDIIKNSNTDYDEIGHVISGFGHRQNAANADSIYNYIHLIKTKINSGIYMIYNSKDDSYILKCCDENDRILIDEKCYMTKADGSITSVLWEFDGEYVDNYGNSTSYASKNNPYSKFVETTIPIFNMDDPDFDDNVQEYIDNGDTSGCENSDSLVNNKPKYDEDVELPQKLYCVSGYNYQLLHDLLVYLTKDIVINWQQNVDTSDYTYDIDVKFVEKLTFVKLKGNEHKTVISKWYTYKENLPYNSSKNITYTFDKNDLNNLLKDFETHTSFKNDDGDSGLNTLQSMSVRVRNKVGKKCSHYVTIVINFETGNVTLSETDEDEKVVDNAEYDNDDGTTSEDGGNDGNNFGSLSSILQYIRDGFGLIGNGGILTLMSATFLYLPNSIWIILKFFVSMMVAIALVKLVKDVIL